MAKKGRKQRPYHTSWGEVIPGFARCTDGRWRIIAVDQRFTEPDEIRAIARFRKWQRTEARESVSITVPHSAFQNDTAFFDAWQDGGVDLSYTHDLEATLGVKLPHAVFWAWLREQLIKRPGWVAEQVGIPELATLANFNLPKPPILINSVLKAYRKHSTADDKSKNEAVKPFMRLVDFANAKTLDDLSDEKLMSFREVIVKEYADGSSDTVKAYFARIRTVINLSGRELDGAQVKEAHARCKTKLYPPPRNVNDDPRPISRENFLKLLDGAQRTKVSAMWRAMLLLGLNSLFYMEDLRSLRWEKIDLVKGCIVTRRRKKGRCLQVSMLWPITIEALSALPRRGQSPYVFTSAHGTRYNKNTKVNDFRDFCEKVGVEGVTFSHLRDGGYTAAYRSLGVDAKFVELLAGHATGIRDKYVLRDPEMVRPATDAIYRAYFL